MNVLVKVVVLIVSVGMFNSLIDASGRRHFPEKSASVFDTRLSIPVAAPKQAASLVAVDTACWSANKVISNSRRLERRYVQPQTALDGSDGMGVPSAASEKSRGGIRIVSQETAATEQRRTGKRCFPAKTVGDVKRSSIKIVVPASVREDGDLGRKHFSAAMVSNSVLSWIEQEENSVERVSGKKCFSATESPNVFDVSGMTEKQSRKKFIAAPEKQEKPLHRKYYPDQSQPAPLTRGELKSEIIAAIDEVLGDDASVALYDKRDIQAVTDAAKKVLQVSFKGTGKRIFSKKNLVTTPVGLPTDAVKEQLMAAVASIPGDHVVLRHGSEDALKHGVAVLISTLEKLKSSECKTADCNDEDVIINALARHVVVQEGREKGVVRAPWR